MGPLILPLGLGLLSFELNADDVVIIDWFLWSDNACFTEIDLWLFRIILNKYLN